MAIVLKENTKKGQDIIARGSHYKGTELRQVYSSWSKAKEQAWSDCYDKFLATPDSEAFSICSANTYGFTCSWLGKYTGEDALFYETRFNSYIVIFDPVEER